MHGQQPAWVDDGGFCFVLFCTCEQRYPQLCLGYLERNLGQVGRSVATGAVLSHSQEQWRWESSTEHKWGGWDAVAALRKMETIWNSCHGLGTRGWARAESKAGLLSDWEEASLYSRCGLAVQLRDKGRVWGQGWMVTCWFTWRWHRPALRMWLYREMLRWTAKKWTGQEVWACSS